jgi:hypothetical protein
MKKLHFRQQQLLISAIGAALILPAYFFLGVMFTFGFKAGDSAWAWVFDLIAFWSQIGGIVGSFFKPRVAARWMLVCIWISVALAVGFLIKSGYAPGARHLSAAEWMGFLPRMLKTAAFFWGLPLIFALLLSRDDPSSRTSLPGC